MIVYKFVNWDVDKPKNITLADIVQCFRNGDYKLSGFNGIIRLGGWAYDFRDDLRHYVIKQYGNWREYYAPNKTLLRKNIFGRIEYILEIPKK